MALGGERNIPYGLMLLLTGWLDQSDEILHSMYYE
jgi:hypothetical protein